jgi:hypothetical protein
MFLKTTSLPRIEYDIIYIFTYDYFYYHYDNENIEDNQKSIYGAEIVCPTTQAEPFQYENTRSLVDSSIFHLLFPM